METKNILTDIAKRCNGDIYLGVVGPVRTGKSSFIKRFMEMAIIPYIEDEDAKIRAIDELPQSGKGRMIMTVEPKFIPNQAVTIDLEDNLNVQVRLVDSVGYVIDGAKGYKDEQGVRLIKTPWYLDSIPFDKAAEVGTKKVIQDHSTIGIVVTCDGTISD
ncbi:MAG: stage IV sporulation protein A, partial [Coprobacillaceae bacterium]